MITRVVIRPAQAGQELQIARLIAEVFHPLAISNWLAPDPGRRLQAQSDQFAMLVQHAMAHGAVYTTPSLHAAAVWMPVHGPEPVPPLRADYSRRLRHLTGDAAHYGRFAQLDRAMERHHPQMPHWHLMFLAVRPHLRSIGIGSQLLHAHHMHLDSMRLGAYLEATDEHAVRFYSRRGYLPWGGPFRPADDAPPLTPMWRFTQAPSDLNGE